MRTVIIHTIILLYLFTMACGQKSDDGRLCVVDNAYLLTDEQSSKLTEQILELEASIGSQIAILTIDSLNKEKIEDYSLRTANAWALGRKGYDDGVLITIALYDRQMRIEVGNGLQKIIRDDIAARIIEEDMAPNFRQEKYYEGLSIAVGKINTLIKDNENLVGQR